MLNQALRAMLVDAIALPLCPAPDMDVFGVLRNLPGEVEMLLGETLPNGHIRLG